ncbi:MAG: phenylalanine--tRNA ligase subunit alpha [Thermoleophilaceae bacterium]|jgi:phenylalanyl-tRNA synthetase alpha chain|nr:phenylalanine--tRNA ligase subunit alpha [Thermoleophilaceae bacterium]
MADAPARLAEIRAEAQEAVASARSAAELEELRVRYLGRKSELTGMLRSIRELPPEQRGPVGKGANEVKQALEGRLAQRMRELEASELDERLRTDAIDVTLPGDPPAAPGSLHLITETRREIEDVFLGLGFSVAEGPEVEFDYYNFTALNHPPNHPARMLADTFYFSDDVLLRTHTSPVQVRAMEGQGPPIYVIVPGKTYRRDSDATHTPMFHQIEGLAIDEDITLADLQGVLLEFARAIFGPDRQIRLRPHYFPFTEPSVEVDVSCFNCGGTGWLGSTACRLCKGSGWIEILGSGMVDPNVLGFVADNGYDPEKVQGFAFGMGIERIAMLRHGVPDLRMFFDNDLRFLEQFGS